MSRRELKKILSFSMMAVSVLTLAVVPATTFAANTPTLNQLINAGTLETNILDNSQAVVASPSFNMSAKNASFTCLSGVDASTGTLGADAQRLYVMNPGAANNGWTLTMAATSGATATWTSGGNSFDFNDANDSGCTDGADTDSMGGQLTVDPSAGAVTTDCTSCTATNVTKGSSTGFAQGTTDSVTLMSASASAEPVWRGYLTGAALSQTLPADTTSGTYSLNMTLTATAL